MKKIAVITGASSGMGKRFAETVDRYGTYDEVWVIARHEAQLEALRAEACTTGELIKLNEEKLPGCYLHRSAVNDVARVEGRTFICTRKKEDAGTINNWMAPQEC